MPENTNIDAVINNAMNQVSGKNKTDWSDLILVDTNGVMFEAGTVFSVSIGVLKDVNEHAITKLMTDLFGKIGIELKAKQPREREQVKEVDVLALLAQK